MATQTQRFLQGETVDAKYQIGPYLGGAGHSSVFLTQYGELHPRDAAIKLVPAPAGAAEAQLSRWRLAANFSHPHLVQVLDMGRCELNHKPMLYVVTEFASENLAELIPERTLTPDEAREMLAHVLDLLAFIHSRGFVHGHIKPANIMAVGEQLKLSSDGICRLGEEIEHPSVPSIYDPPEGYRNGASPAGDMWSLGVTIIEVLTQHVPAWTPADPKDPVLPESLPASFVDLVRHCLRRNPKSRWSAADAAAHLPRITAVAVPAAPSPRVTAVPVPAAPPRSSTLEIAETKPEPEAPAEQQEVEQPYRSPVERNYGLPAKIIGSVAVLAFLALVGWRIISQRPDTSATAQVAPVSASASDPQPTRTATSERAVPSGEPASAKAKKPAGHNAVTTARLNPAPAAQSPSPTTKPVSPTAAASASASRPSGSAPVTSAAVQPSPDRASHADVPPSPSVAAAPHGSLGAAASHGSVLQQVLPDVPKRASETIWGTVRVAVKVSVDAAGNVTGAALDSSGPSRYFANLSLQAARQWKFTPPTANGTAVPSSWILHFNYTKAGPSAAPSQTLP